MGLRGGKERKERVSIVVFIAHKKHTISPFHFSLVGRLVVGRSTGSLVT